MQVLDVEGTTGEMLGNSSNTHAWSLASGALIARAEISGCLAAYGPEALNKPTETWKAAGYPPVQTTHALFVAASACVGGRARRLTLCARHFQACSPTQASADVDVTAWQAAFGKLVAADIPEDGAAVVVTGRMRHDTLRPLVPVDGPLILTFHIAPNPSMSNSCRW